MANKDLTITIIQPDIIWNNISDNLWNYSSILEKNNKKSDLILLPEMFATGFTTNPLHLAESMDGETIRWMRNISEKNGCSIAGSVVIKEHDRYYNRLLFINASGSVELYDKRHLFRMEGEEIHYAPGEKRLIVTVNGWRINFQICYDLRFPVWSKNLNDYDLLVNVANWPGRRSNVWNTLLKARAIENQAYVIGVNRTGKDGNGISYKGESQVISPEGNVMLNMKLRKNALEIITLSLDELLDFREKFPVWRDWDRFTIEYNL